MISLALPEIEFLQIQTGMVTNSPLWIREDWIFSKKDETNLNIIQQAQLAIDYADVILFFVDGRAGLSAKDKEVADFLQKNT